MADYLYYRRSEEWVQVQADSYERISSDGPTGQCPGILYRITFTQNFVYTQFGSNYQENIQGSAVRTIDRRGPIAGPIHYFEGQIAYVDIFIGPNQARINWNVRSGRRFVVTDSLPPTNISMVPLEDLPPECQSSSCETSFTLNGSETLRLSHCPEITNGRGCSDCCRELLPLLRSLHI